jgi:hypothetical protein
MERNEVRKFLERGRGEVEPHVWSGCKEGELLMV